MTLLDSAPLSDIQLVEQFNPTQYTPSRTKKRENFSVFPSNDEIKLAGDILQLFRQARAIRRPKVAEWDKNYRMLRGKFWNTAARKAWLPTTSIPEIFSIVRSNIGWMTDRRFHHIVSVAAAPFTNYYHIYSQLASDLECVLDSTWQVNQEEAEITKMLWDASQLGTGILKTTWDDALAGGMGDAKQTRIDPHGFYPDPIATNLQDGNYYIEVKKMSLQELDRRFPGAWKKLEGNLLENFDEAPNQYSQNGTNIPRANPAALDGASGSYLPPGSGQRSARSLDDLGVTVFEAWLREHERYEATVTDPERGDEKEEHVYDTWRVVVVAGNRVLMDERADDLWDHGQHPYSRYCPYDLGEFWGISLVELLSSSQETINRLLASAVQNIELTGNPIFVEDNRAGTQRQAIYNQPGQRFTKNQQGQIQWMEPPRIQADIPQFLNYILSRMQVIAGLSDQSRGVSPKGRNSSEVMDAVNESALVSVRMALRQLEYCLSDSGYKKASLIIQNYTMPRMAAIIGPTGDRTTMWLRARHFMLPTSKGAAPMQYSLNINAGSNEETSRKVRADEAKTLFTLGALDLASLHEALNIPHSDQIIENLQKQAMAGMEPPGKRKQAQH